MMQPVEGRDPAGERPRPNEGPGKSQGKKQPPREEPSRGLRAAKRLFSEASSLPTLLPTLPSSARPQASLSAYSDPTLRSHTRSRARALSSLTATLDQESQSQAAGDSPVPRRAAAPPGNAGRCPRGSAPLPSRAACRRRHRAAPLGSAGSLSSDPPPRGRPQHRPARRRSVTTSGPTIGSRPSSQSHVVTPGLHLPSRGTQGRSAFPYPPGPASQHHPVAINVFVQRSGADAELSDGPDPESPRLASRPARAVRMRASSPSPPGRIFPLPGHYGESFPSSPSSTPGRSSSSSSSTSSPSATPGFLGLRAISTPSPNSLRRALMPELDVLLDALSPASLEEQDEIGE
ncbi:EZH inhibitory protein [Echinops telfairi]|uniref:EZH inhibitory protein n=1 Tax=Echinops telfairi TaxID=9371 RepID=A0ABM0J8N6_ECHTE|nr:EZH inhibitory protein [Echinops telfairi]